MRGWLWRTEAGRKIYRHVKIVPVPAAPGISRVPWGQRIVSPLLIIRTRRDRYWVGENAQATNHCGSLKGLTGPFETFEAAELHWKIATGVD